MSLLLDTSTLVDLQRRWPPAVAWVGRQARRQLSISAVTVFELSVGAERPDALQALQRSLDTLVVIAVDEVIAARAGALFRRYGPSHGTGRIDALIAATAMVARLPLVTANLKHFPMLPDAVSPY